MSARQLMFMDLLIAASNAVMGVWCFTTWGNTQRYPVLGVFCLAGAVALLWLAYYQYRRSKEAP